MDLNHRSSRYERDEIDLFSNPQNLKNVDNVPDFLRLSRGTLQKIQTTLNILLHPKNAINLPYFQRLSRGKESRRQDLHLQPLLYKSIALLLSYSGIKLHCIIHYFLTSSNTLHPLLVIYRTLSMLINPLRIRYNS